jgi:hypothetical protein
MTQTRSTEEMAAPMLGAGAPGATRIPPSSGLPGWDSFPLADRRLVVQLLVQTARRRVQNRPTTPVGGPGR